MELSKLEKINSSIFIDELLNNGITYCSITLLNSDGDSYFSKSSSDKWFEKYMNSGLYQKCHLMTEASSQIKNHKTGFVFVWDKYFPINEESHYLNQLRKENDIDHGVAFCSQLNNGSKLILTVTGKHHDINFSKNVIRNKAPIYKAIIQSLINP